MSDRPTVGLALIVKNEEQSLPRALGSVEGAFDQVALLDTGSTDKTVSVFEDWAARERERQPDFIATLGHFEWVDDFAAARRAADALLTTDWAAWLDADDSITHPEILRTLAAHAPLELGAYIFHYAYAHDAQGNCVCSLKRERLVRAGCGDWQGRVHEAQGITGLVQQVAPEVCEWVHHKTADAPDSNARNLRILRRWVKDEPDNPRVLAYLGTENAARGKHKQAVGYYKRYLKLVTHWDEERAQIHRKLSMSLMALGRPQEAAETALAAMLVMPRWPDSYLTLAQTCYQLGEHDKAIQWAERVLELGQPDSLLILNPLDYVGQPRLVLAAAHGALGRHEEALRWADEAFQVMPDHEELQGHAAHWRSVLKREHTANTWVGAAQMLVQHDEQLKALHLLEQTVPHFCQDHPNVVALRSQVRERVRPLLEPAGTAEHYSDPTEDGMPVEVAATLPRAQFLRDGLLDQLAEAA